MIIYVYILAYVMFITTIDIVATLLLVLSFFIYYLINILDIIGFLPETNKRLSTMIIYYHFCIS